VAALGAITGTLSVYVKQIYCKEFGNIKIAVINRQIILNNIPAHNHTVYSYWQALLTDRHTVYSYWQALLTTVTQCTVTGRLC
jgi:hypothetical protein